MRNKKTILKAGLLASLLLLSATISSAKMGDEITKRVKPLNGILIPNIFDNQDSIPTNKPDPVYLKVDTLPSINGGVSAFGKFLSKNLRYPPVARDAGIQGKVILTFIVEKDGALSNIKVLHGIGGGCDEEAIRVMKLSPLWIPGTQDGKTVRVLYTIPIVFQLAGRKEKLNN